MNKLLKETTETKRTEDQRWYTVGERAADKREIQQQHAGSPLTTARECPSTNTSNGNVNNITTRYDCHSWRLHYQEYTRI